MAVRVLRAAVALATLSLSAPVVGGSLPGNRAGTDRTSDRRAIRSPALWSQDRLAMTIPLTAGVRIQAQEPAVNWRSSAYDVDLAVSTRGGKSDALRLEVLQYAWGRAERKGMLDGQRFRTQQRRHAILTMVQFDWEGKAFTNWYFAFVAPKSQNVTIIRFDCETAAADRLYPLACQMVRGTRFTAAQKRTSPR